MGTTTDKLNKLIQTKAAIKSAIETKGGTVAANAPFADYADAILDLPSGGSSNLIADLLADNVPTIDIDLRGITSNPQYIYYIFDNAPSSNLYNESLISRRNKNINYWSPNVTEGGGWFSGLKITDEKRHATLYEGYEYFAVNKLTFKQTKTESNDPINLGLPAEDNSWTFGPRICNARINSLEIGNIIGTEINASFLVGLSKVNNISITPGATWEINPYILLLENPTNQITLTLPTLRLNRFRMPMIGGMDPLSNITLIVPSVSTFTWASGPNSLTYGPGLIKMLGTTPAAFTYNANHAQGTIFYVPLSAYNDYIVTTGWVNLYNDERIYPMVIEDTTYTINYKDADGVLILSVQGTLATYEKAEITLAKDSLANYLHDEVTFSLLNGTSFDVTVYPLVNRSITINYKDDNDNIISTETKTVEVGDGGYNTILVQTGKVSNDVSYYYNTTLTVTEDNQIFNVTPLTDKVLVVKVAGGDYPSDWSVTKEEVSYYNTDSETIGKSDDTVMFRLAAANLPSGTAEGLRWRNSQKLTLNNANGSVIVYPAKILKSGSYYLSLSSTLTSSPISEYTNTSKMRFDSSTGTLKWTGNLSTDYTVSLGGSFYTLSGLYMFLAFRKSELNVDYILFDNGDGTITLQ